MGVVDGGGGEGAGRTFFRAVVFLQYFSLFSQEKKKICIKYETMDTFLVLR